MSGENPDRVWVAVRVQDGTQIGEYYGQVRAKLLAEILNTPAKPDSPAGPQWLELESTFWITQDGKWRRQSAAGRQWGYDDTVYFRVSHLMRIVPLTDDFVQEILGYHREEDRPLKKSWQFWK
jgi:hypothetical protein